MKSFKETKAKLIAGIKLGEWHDVGIAFLGRQKAEKTMRLKIINIREDSDFTAVLTCQNEDGVGGFWIAPHWETQFTQRVVSIDPANTN